MTNIFLRAVELSNFRVYGDCYAFELPDGPGITIITGANGLGKTSFFDGIEWALTGQISRFSDLLAGKRSDQDPLTRIGAPEGSHRVSLGFSNAPAIDRGNGFKPDEATIANLLTLPGWNIENLHSYLSITHFLGQASTRRFSLREPKAQWEALKGPAGVDRINALRERISGQGARQAFTRAIRARSDALDAANLSLEKWREISAARDRLARLSSSELALSPGQVREEVSRLAEQLLILMPDVQFAPPAPGEEPEGWLNRLAQLIEMSSARATGVETLCAELGGILTAFDDVTTSLSANADITKDLAERRGATLSAIADAEAAIAEANSAFALSQQNLARLKDRRTLIARVVQSDEQLQRATTEIAAIDADRASSITASKHAAHLLDEHRASLANVRARRSARGDMQASLVSAEQRARLSTALTGVRNEVQRVSDLIEQRDVDELRATRVLLHEQLSQANSEISRLAGELRQNDDRARALADAVAVIAKHLTPHDEHCPVCTTSFDAGQLAAIALAQAAKSITPSADMAASMVMAQNSRESLVQQAAAVDRQLSEHDQLFTTLHAEQTREGSLVVDLIAVGGNPDLTYGAADVEAVATQIAAADTELERLPTEEHLETAIREVETAIEAERIKQTSLEQRRAQVAAEVESARSFLLLHPDMWSAQRGLDSNLVSSPIDAQAELETLEQALQRESEGLDLAKRALDNLRADLGRQNSGIDRAREEANAFAERRRKLVEDWGRLGQPGEPAQSWIDQLQGNGLTSRQRTEVVASAHADMINRFRRWQRDQELQAREGQIRTELERYSLPSVAAVTEHLERDVAEARRGLDLAQRARERMESIGTNMQARADRYAVDVLKPLNKTIQRFARPLMTWTDASIIYRAEHLATRSELRPTIERTAADGVTRQFEMNPNLFFSEGQLSALSVSALLAASTTFQWSTWRGLLLDDPLQHNDVIHASAFMDLLRQMVRELDYQVILSTHDSAEAEFLIRKCRSAGITHCVHELEPQGEEGLVSAAA